MTEQRWVILAEGEPTHVIDGDCAALLTALDGKNPQTWREQDYPGYAEARRLRNERTTRRG